MAIVEADDGLYYVSYTAEESATLKVYVTINALEIPGSPFLVRNIANNPVGRTSIASGLATEKVMMDKVTTFTLQACDSYNNRRRVGGSANTINVFSLPTLENCNQNKTAGLQSALVGVDDNGDGTYSVSFKSPSRTSFYLCVMFMGEIVSNGPMLVAGLPDPDVDASLKIAMMVLASIVIVLLCIIMYGIFHYSDQKLFKAASPTFLVRMLF